VQLITFEHKNIIAEKAEMFDTGWSRQIEAGSLEIEKSISMKKRRTVIYKSLSSVEKIKTRTPETFSSSSPKASCYSNFHTLAHCVQAKMSRENGKFIATSAMRINS
jgi:hypothetical protein